MLQIEKKLNICPDIHWELLAPVERVVFLDIETTGFKASRSALYLIGVSHFTGGNWVLHQFFAESGSDDINLLHALSEFLREKKKGQDHLILVTYNGDGFDLPFLKEVEREYGEYGLLKDVISLDLFREIKPYKKIAKLNDLKLKTVEKECGIERADPYSGGDLISVYEEYLRLCRIPKGGSEDNALNASLKARCMECLLLHNAEDIADMIPVMRIMGYKYLFDGSFDFEKAEILELRGKKVLDLRFKLKERLPKELYIDHGETVISVSGEDAYLLKITTEIEKGERRLYYPDYKNYYYLPAEDMAIHKSVGEFVDRKNRIKATASTCYTRETGEYFAVPQSFEKSAPFFYNSYKGTAYARFSMEMIENDAVWKEYALAVLGEILH